MITKTRQRQADALFMHALALPPCDRDGFFDRRCGDDHALRRLVARQVLADRQAGDFLVRPLGRVLTSPAATHRDEPAGRRIGTYRLIRPIGRGGMATVYLADCAQQGAAPVAVKVLHGDWLGSDVAHRFEVERRILGRLDHPSLPRLLDAGRTPGGRPYVVMPWVDGSSLDLHCQRLRHAQGQHHVLEQGLDLFARVCRAVREVHRHAIVHCDLKPANIVIDRRGHPTVLDFGIATQLAPEHRAARRPYDPMRMLTPRYASPEQRNGGRITPATDVYALGTILAEVAGGAVAEAECSRSISAAPTSATRWPGTRPQDGQLAAIVRRARHPVAARRYPSVRQLCDDLRRYRHRLAKRDPCRPLDAGRVPSPMRTEPPTTGPRTISLQ